jgi:aspartyl/asparaginyl beta-hydroxylase (cupin superfamily)
MAVNYMRLVSLLGPVNRLFDLHTGGPRRPVFYDIDEVRPELAGLRRQFPAIRRELLSLLDGTEAPRCHEVDRMQTYISATTDKDWRVFYLYLIGEKPEANRARCPVTCAALDRVPGVFQALFSILDPGKSIPSHEGPYRGYLRYHLGLIVPEQDPPQIRIKDQIYTWREGEDVLFDDTWEHEVTNHSTGRRVVLIVDIRRPMPLPLTALNRFVELIMRMVYGKQVVKMV